jgi:hypothetical protein
MGSREVHSVVGLVSAGEDTLWGVLSLAGVDGPWCCFGVFRVRMGWQWLGVFYISPRDSHGQRLWLVAHWCSWWLVLMRGGSVAFSVAGSAMRTFCWAAH